MKKRIFALILTLVMILTLFAFPATAVGGGLGDVDRDGKVTAGDARLALRAAVGLETLVPGSVEFLAADTDRDGKLTASDARLALRASVSLETLPEVLPSPASTVSFTENGAYTRAADKAVYDDALSRFTALMEKAQAETDPDVRFVLFGEAEAYLLDAAVMFPTTTTGGNYAISCIAPKVHAAVDWGSDGDRLANYVVTTKPIKVSDRDAMIALWDAARKGSGTYDPAAYLTAHGYTLSDVYRVTFSAKPDTLNWVTTGMSADIEILVNLVDGLVQYDNLGMLRPAIAKSWDVSADGLTYTFRLRNDVNWFSSDGKIYAKLTAKDFETAFACWGHGENSLSDLANHILKSVKATDAYTLVYTLQQPTPYFLSMLSYVCFDPICTPFYEKNKETYANVNDLSSQVYCGAYLPEAIGDDEIVLKKNPGYYRAETVNLKELRWMNGNEQNPEDLYEKVIAGSLSGMALGGASGLLQKAKDDGNFEKYAYTAATTSTTYFCSMNLNRGTFALNNGACASGKSDAQKASAATALNNKNFRKAVAFALDKVAFNAALVGPENAAGRLRNMYTAPNLVSLGKDVTDEKGHVFPKGTLYGELVQYYCDYIGLGIDVSDGVNGWYNADRAAAYLGAAKEDLGDKVQFPIVLDIVYFAASDSQRQQAEAYKKSVEAALGSQNVRIDLIPAENPDDYYDCGSLAETGKDCNYDLFYGAGWAADFGDPSTYLTTFLYESGYMRSLLGIDK